MRPMIGDRIVQTGHRIVLRLLYVVYVAATAAVLSTEYEESGSIPLAAWLLPIMLVGAIYIGETRVLKIGLTVLEDGLLHTGTFKHRLYAWRDLERFEVIRDGVQKQIYAVVNGEKVRLDGVRNGTKMKWSSGETRTIDETLNELLAQHRRASDVTIASHDATATHH